jgi:hypothetical protein
MALFEENSKSQAPNPKPIGILDFGFVWDLEFGIWNFP